MAVGKAILRRLTRPIMDRLDRQLRVAEDSLRASDQIRVSLGRIETVLRENAIQAEDAEFRVFSQFGDDGILQYILRRVDIMSRTFVEFGVESYAESNTRFLAEGFGWTGWAFDVTDNHIHFVRDSGLSWRQGIRASVARIDAENVNEVFTAAGVEAGLSLLSIDVDGIDYWIWRALSVVEPRIVVVEYNSMFGPDLKVTVPYDPSFDRASAHFSHLYFGASLSALCALAHSKGYILVASNAAGVNAFFVRADVAGELRPLRPADVWRRSVVRESRAPDGSLTHLDPHIEGLALLKDLPLLNLDTGVETPIGRLFRL